MEIFKKETREINVIRGEWEKAEDSNLSVLWQKFSSFTEEKKWIWCRIDRFRFLAIASEAESSGLPFLFSGRVRALKSYRLYNNDSKFEFLKELKLVPEDEGNFTYSDLCAEFQKLFPMGKRVMLSELGKELSTWSSQSRQSLCHHLLSPIPKKRKRGVRSKIAVATYSPEGYPEQVFLYPPSFPVETSLWLTRLNQLNHLTFLRKLWPEMASTPKIDEKKAA
jgi:hypothetical protein